MVYSKRPRSLRICLGICLDTAKHWTVMTALNVRAVALNGSRTIRVLLTPSQIVLDIPTEISALFSVLLYFILFLFCYSITTFLRKQSSNNCQGTERSWESKVHILAVAERTGWGAVWPPDGETARTLRNSHTSSTFWCPVHWCYAFTHTQGGATFPSDHTQ